MLTVSMAASPLLLLLLQQQQPLVYLKENEGDCTLTMACVQDAE